MTNRQEASDIFKDMETSLKELLPIYSDCVENLFNYKSEQKIANSIQDQRNIIHRAIFRHTGQSEKVYLLSNSPSSLFDSQNITEAIQESANRQVHTIIAYPNFQETPVMNIGKNVSLRRISQRVGDESYSEFITNGEAICIRLKDKLTDEVIAIPYAPSIAKQLIGYLEERLY